MYKIYYTNRMKKDVKLMKRRGKDLNKLVNVLSLLSDGSSLPVQYKDHSLIGNLQGFRECHIEPDWLLMYQIHEDTLILSATATGSHADGDHFVILTTKANASMEPVHDRMPLILDQDDIMEWIFNFQKIEQFLSKEPCLLNRRSECEQLSMF